MKDLLKVPYVAARARVEPMTLRRKGVDSTNAPHTPHILFSRCVGKSDDKKTLLSRSNIVLRGPKSPSAQTTIRENVDVNTKVKGP